MTDRTYVPKVSDVDSYVRTIIAAALDLQDAAASEWLGAAFSPSSDGTRSSPGPADPTGTRAEDERKWTDAQRIEDRLSKFATSIDRFADQFRSREGGGQCARPGCTGPATHSGHCPDCWHYHRNCGIWPDEVVYTPKDEDTGEPTGRKRTLTADRNDRRKRDCACSGKVKLSDGSEVVCCDDHTSLSRDRCRRRISVGDRHLDCSTCRGRQSRILEAEREAS